MLYTNRIKNPTSVYPRLSRVWIKTDNPKMPLKSVWIEEEKLLRGELCTDEHATSLADDHLAFAANPVCSLWTPRLAQLASTGRGVRI